MNYWWFVLAEVLAVLYIASCIFTYKMVCRDQGTKHPDFWAVFWALVPVINLGYSFILLIDG